MDPSLGQPDQPDAVTDDGDMSSNDDEPPPRRRLDLEIVEDDGDWQALGAIDTLVGAVQRILADAPELAPMAHASAAIALSSDAAVRRLNATYRGKDSPTNVLSFPAPHAPASLLDNGAPREIGDVILAVETVLAEAADAGIPPAHHFQHLLIHGVLHLVGYDHQTDAEAEAMEALETTLLARLGIADPHATVTHERAPTPPQPRPRQTRP